MKLESAMTSCHLKTLSITLSLALCSLLPTTAGAAIAGTDSFTGSESIMSPRFLRQGTAGGACSTFSSGDFQYRTYPVQASASGRVIATFNPGACGTNIFVTFHNGTFDPANICTNHVWDFGSSLLFTNQAFQTTPNANLTMVVSGVQNSPGVVCGPYSWLMGNQNIALRKLKAVNVTSSGKDSWQASYTYNAERRDGSIFNPATENFYASFAGQQIQVLAGSFKVSPSGVFTYKSEAGNTPVFTVKITPTKQIIDVKVSKISDFGMNLPSQDVANEVVMGDDVFQFTTRLSDKGTYIPLNAYQEDNFVVTSNTIKNVNSPDKGSIKTKMFLESPKTLADFTFADCKDNCNKPSVILRLKDNGNTLLEKDMTGLIAANKTIDKKTGSPVYMLKKVGKDSAVENILSAFSYTSKTGALSLSMTKLLPIGGNMTDYQSPLMVELVIDGDTFTTNITMFATDADSNGYSSSFTKFSPLLL